MIARPLCAILILCTAPCYGQPVTCRPFANGEAFTLLCSNGFFITNMPDGSQVTGVIGQDPNASVRGSGIVLDQGGKTTGAVTSPTTPSGAAPGSWLTYGAPVP